MIRRTLRLRFLPLAILFAAALAAPSARAQVTVSNLWSISTAEGRPYLTNASATSYTERGAAYSALNNRAYIVSRATTPPTVAVLDGDTGAHVGMLNVTGVFPPGTPNGTFALSTIGVADDGAVYAANLTVSVANGPYRIYRWTNEVDPPTLVYSANPSANRYGESFDVRGSGTNTEIIATANGAAVVAVFKPTDDSLNTFAGTVLNVSGLGAAADLTKGVGFGPTNTFFGKNSGAANIRHCRYDLAGGTATVIASYPVTTGLSPLDALPAYNLLAGVESTNGPTPHNLRVYDISGGSAAQIYINPFPAPATNNGNIVGQVQIAGDRIFAIDTQNGVQMAKIYVSALPVPPSITTSPASQTVVLGGFTSLSVGATGTQPLSYQWYFNGGTPIVDATNSTLYLTNLTAGEAGQYSVTVTNIAGSSNSAAATLTLSPAVLSLVATQCWRIAVGERTYITADNAQRGLAYNAVFNEVLVVTRTPALAIHVLDADTGAYKHSMDLTGVAGGTFALNMIACSEDGQVFAGNLTTNPKGADGPFKLYGWFDTTPATAPAVVWSGDPDFEAAITNRWGDNLDVRGSGLAVEAVIGARNSRRVAILPLFFDPAPPAIYIDTPDAEAGNFGLSVIWGPGDTVWGKSSGTALRHVSLDRNSRLGTVLRTITAYPTMAAFDVDEQNGIVAGMTLETPDTLRLVDIAQPASVTELDTHFFASDNANANGTGEVRFGPNKIFALDSNNGIIALRYGSRLSQSLAGSTLTFTWPGTQKLQATGDLTQPFTNVLGAASGFLFNTSLAPQTFFRLSD